MPVKVTDGSADWFYTKAELDAILSGLGGGAAFPVGSIFLSTVATDPATLLGYGTWAAFGTGRLLVGLDAGQTEFDTLGKTGGAKTVTLTAAQSGLPQHTHVQDAHNHTQDSHNHTQDPHTHVQDPHLHGIGCGTSDGTGGIDQSTTSATNRNTANATATNQNATATNQAATATNQAATATNQNAGPADASSPHENLPPYIVVQMWLRTA